MRKLRVVQIGTEHDHAADAMRQMKSMPEVFDIAGFVRVEEKDTFFKKHPADYENVRELTLSEALADPTIEAAIIETEDCFLTEYAFLAAKHGWHVEMDKPGSQDHEAFVALSDYCEAHGLVFHLGYMYRYNPAFQKILKLKNDGTLGRILSVYAEMSCYHAEPKRKWLAGYKGGMTYFLGCHLIDAVLQLMGEPDEVIPMNSRSSPDYGEDIGLALLRYNGIPSTVKTLAAEAGGFIRREIVVVGEKGTAEIKPIEYYPFGDGRMQTDLYVSIVGEGGEKFRYTPEKETFPPYYRLEAMLSEFAACCAGEQKNPYSYDYEKKVHEILLKASGA